MHSAYPNKMLIVIVILALLQMSESASERSVIRYFDKLNNHTKNFNALEAQLEWNYSLHPINSKSREIAKFQEKLLKWRQVTCNKLEVVQYLTVLNKTQERMISLFCRRPKYTLYDIEKANTLIHDLQKTYADAEICLQSSQMATWDNLTSIDEAITDYLAKDKWRWVREKVYILSTKDGFIRDPAFLCVKGETDFNRIMSFSRNTELLKWIWETWRDVMSDMKDTYQLLVNLENNAALKNGYLNVGESWCKDLEINNLRELCGQLYQNIKPLYTLLHGVTRYFLRREYGTIIPERGPIPAHLLGDLWAQNWESLADIILPKTIDLNKEMKEGKVKWDINHMFKRAEDFYVSLGLPAMTEAFWRESIFSTKNYTTSRSTTYTEAHCRSAAVDMFKDGDFRLIYCGDVTFQDFQVIHHQMGHIQYYMAYEKQPGIFRQANAVLHESIGDAVMYGAMTPQHLHRLGLINDSVLYSEPEVEIDLIISNVSDVIKEVIEEDYENLEWTVPPVEYMLGDMPDTEPEITPDDILLLKQALSKLPKIPFALAMDEYKWNLFEGKIKDQRLNTEFWEIVERFQGVAPDNNREDWEYFDAGGKFHFPDNTPFVRYFLSSFLQHQLFESLCKSTVYGQRHVKEQIPSSIVIHRCDIYGSKSAGKLLRDIMSRGYSQPLQEILKATIDDSEISSGALERYYRPLQDMLQRLVDKYQIPLGW